MAKGTHTVEKIMIKLREIGVLCSQGKTIAEVVGPAE